MAHVVEKWAARGTNQLFDTEEGALAAGRAFTGVVAKMDEPERGLLSGQGVLSILILNHLLLKSLWRPAHAQTSLSRIWMERGDKPKAEAAAA